MTEEAAKKQWTQQDTNFVIENFSTMPVVEISTRLGFSRETIYTKAENLGLMKGRNQRKRKKPIGTESINLRLEKATIAKLQDFADILTDGNLSETIRIILRAAIRVRSATVDFDSKFEKQLRKMKD